MKKIIVLLIFLLVACSKDDPIIQYSISVQVTPVEGGSVSPSTGKFNEGTSISLLATPTAEYIFKNWSGGASGISNPTTVVMKSNKSITAVFEKKDADGDGVADDVDMCPNSTAGETVDENGCSESQEDDDLDGINNNLDECPDTPPGETVDNKGCSHSQKYTYIPDDNFEQALVDWGFDDVMDDYVLTSNIDDMISISLFNLEISDLTGIENFAALNELICYGNQLTSLDLSENIELKHLNCSNNQLTSLVVSKNTSLTHIDCNGNELTSLDVSNNTVLELIDCSKNQLTSLDVSQNTALTKLLCVDNELTSLDVSQNTAVEHLSCGRNQLTSLDISQNLALKHLGVHETQLTSIDVSQNTELIGIDCSRNQLTRLDVSQNTELRVLTCSVNELTSLNVSKNNSLGILYCGINTSLYCIQVNATQLNSIPDNWFKDDHAIYSLICN